MVIFGVPALRNRFLAYGARSSLQPAIVKEKEAIQPKKASSDVLSTVLDKVETLRVPHSWFASFYTISVIGSLFWAAELLNRGPAFKSLSRYVMAKEHVMTSNQVKLAWFMMCIQGSRRLYECLAISKPSASQMWFGHWLLGILFYVGTSIAIWVEGIRKFESMHYFHPLVADL